MQTSMELLEKSYDYSGSIRYFEEKGRMIAGVYDLLVRGSSKDSTHCIAQWSDIDLSIIVEEINPSLLLFFSLLQKISVHGPSGYYPKPEYRLPPMEI